MKNQSVIEFDGWGAWGAAVLRPYMTVVVHGSLALRGLHRRRGRAEARPYISLPAHRSRGFAIGAGPEDWVRLFRGGSSRGLLLGLTGWIGGICRDGGPRPWAASCWLRRGLWGRCRANCRR